MTFRVSTWYPWLGIFTHDAAAFQAAGRDPDNSGCGLGERDMSWNCRSEIEAQRIKRALTKIGLPVTVDKEQP